MEEPQSVKFGKLKSWSSEDNPAHGSVCHHVFSFIEAQLICNVVFISGIQYGDSYTCVCVLFQTLFPYRLLQNIEWSSQCYPVGPY